MSHTRTNQIVGTLLSTTHRLLHLLLIRLHHLLAGRELVGRLRHDGLHLRLHLLHLLLYLILHLCHRALDGLRGGLNGPLRLRWSNRVERAEMWRHDA